MMKLKKREWKKVKIGEMCEFLSGGTPSRQNHSFYGGDILWVKSGELHSKYIYNTEETLTELGLENSSAKLFPVNSILIALYGVTAGASAILKVPAASNQAINCLIPNENLHHEFLYYVLAFKKEELFRQRVGTYQLNISQPVVRNTSFPLPPIEEQKRIVELFQSVEESIVRAEGQEENLLKLKNQLLLQLFGEKKQFGNHLTARDFEKVKFEKIALSISERVEPKETELDIYVGLEHLDSDDLVIRHRGKPEDVIGTKLKIYKGDIVFGKRRAYLRKVAVSDFEGIVSAHSMVLRANEQNIEKEFLPYFMQSDEFMNRAVQISEGSLSPTIKWKTLAQQEFVLPKKEKQVKLIEVFKQFDATRELLRTQTQALKSLKQKLLNEILGG